MRATPGAIALLAGAAACLGAVAYAAAPDRPVSTAPSLEHRPSVASLPRPSITQHPDKVSTSSSAKFGFTVRGRGVRFRCRLDGEAWSTCRTPVSYAKLAAGSHGFSVRALARDGRRGPAARFRWRVLEPKDFSIVPQLSGLSALYPGAPPVALPVAIANPNPVPIFVTRLSAAATGSPPGCASAENLALSDATLSQSAPLKIPAKGTVSLPAPGVAPPTIQLRDLPFSQDACQRVQFPLSFSGTARG